MHHRVKRKYVHGIVPLQKIFVLKRLGERKRAMCGSPLTICIRMETGYDNQKRFARESIKSVTIPVALSVNKFMVYEYVV